LPRNHSSPSWYKFVPAHREAIFPRRAGASRYLLAEGWLLGELVCTSLYQLDDVLFLAKPVQDFMTCSARNHASPSRYKLVPKAMFPRREGASRYLLVEE
jgi:hypothetical protein